MSKQQTVVSVYQLANYALQESYKDVNYISKQSINKLNVIKSSIILIIPEEQNETIIKQYQALLSNVKKQLKSKQSDKMLSRKQTQKKTHWLTKIFQSSQQYPVSQKIQQTLKQQQKIIYQPLFSNQKQTSCQSIFYSVDSQLFQKKSKQFLLENAPRFIIQKENKCKKQSKSKIE